MEKIWSWLLEGDPWVQYRTRVDLLGQDENNPAVIAARTAMINHPQIQELITELSHWPGAVLKSHKDAKHPIHKLAFLADLGLKADDPGMNNIIQKILSHQSVENPFQVLTNIPAHFGGSGKDEFSWMLCDAPIVIYALIKFGLENDSRVQQAIQYLVELVRDNGWPCAASPVLGKFRGPGRKDDPCPYANLVMLKALSQSSRFRDHSSCRIGAETLLSLWERRMTTKPYLFAMGTDFSKLKAPLIWYDILHVLDVLTQFPWLKKDTRLLEIIEILKSKMNDRGRFTPESIWMAWKGWDFGQKKVPSRWVTLLVHRIFTRLKN
ncbi:hypothetical protein JW964_02830 [candidate division KSB1 bacterium]|nr:hypothetical protein [candidate division KSB1 bacterium]